MKRIRNTQVWVVAVLLLALLGCDSTEMTSAKVYLQQKNYEKAEEMLLLAVQNEPMNPEPAYLLAIEIYARNKDWVKTAEYLNKSVGIGPKFQVQIDQARNKYWVDNFNSGANGYNAMIKGEATDMDKLVERTVKNFENCIAIDPGKPESYGTLAQVYLFLDDMEKGREYMLMAVEKNPNDLASLVNLGNVYFRADEFEKALEYLNRAIEVDPGNINAIKQIAFVYDAMGEKEKASEAYLNAIAADPENPDLHYNLGVLYFQQETYDKAGEEFIRVSELSPDAIDALFNAGLALEKQEKYEDAQKYLEMAVEIDATSVDVVHELKLIYYKLYGVNSDKFKEMDKLEKSLK